MAPGCSFDLLNSVSVASQMCFVGPSHATQMQVYTDFYHENPGNVPKAFLIRFRVLLCFNAEKHRAKWKLTRYDIFDICSSFDVCFTVNTQRHKANHGR